MSANKELIVFPYGITLQEGGKTDTVPVAQVSFTLQQGESISLFLVIDSGAAISALPQSDAEPLGISLHKGEPISISGIDKQPINGWRHKVSIKLENKTIKIPVAFLKDDLCPRILGRAGIFERFTVVFEENKHRTAFVNKNSQQAKQIAKMLNQSAI